MLVVVVLAFVLQSRDVHVLADGATATVSSRSANDAAVVRQAGITIGPGDLIEPVDDGLAVRRAHVATLTVDGQSFGVRTQAETIGDLLLEAGVALGDLDSVLVDGASAQTDTVLPVTSLIEVRRAVPITIVENGHEVHAQSSRGTVGAALDALDVRLGPGDVVRPSLSSELSAGLQVQVDHARQLTVTLPEGKAVLYTHEAEVGPALAASSIGLPAEYRLEPGADTPIAAGLAVRIVGISHDADLETVRIESQTIYEPDPTLPYGSTVSVPGQDGVLHRQFASVYENDTLVSRELSAEWYDPQPVDTIVYYSTAAAPAPAPIAPSVSSGAWSDIVCSYSWNCNTALAIIQCESSGNPNAYNPAGYVGLFQIWEGHGANLTDPATNIAAAYSLYLSGGWGHWPNCP